MDTILQQLYDGKIFPAEQYRPTVEEYKKLYKKHYQHYEDFIKELSQLQKPLDTRFVEIMDEQLDTIPYEISNMFIDGFRLGARMMIEGKRQILMRLDTKLPQPFASWSNSL